MKQALCFVHWIKIQLSIILKLMQLINNDKPFTLHKSFVLLFLLGGLAYAR
jgi:hypothetical protein